MSAWLNFGLLWFMLLRFIVKVEGLGFRGSVGVYTKPEKHTPQAVNPKLFLGLPVFVTYYHYHSCMTLL